MSNQSSSATNWHTLGLEEAAEQLQVKPAQGLSSAEAAQRLQQYGPNQLAGKKKEPGWQAFLPKVRDLIVTADNKIMSPAAFSPLGGTTPA